MTDPRARATAAAATGSPAAPRLRPATLADLDRVVAWLATPRDCERWAGWRVTHPVDRAALPAAIEFAPGNAFALCDGDRLLGFGQLVAKPDGRGHLGRLIVDPAERGRGLGSMLASALVAAARLRGHARISLNVSHGNAAAIAVYARLGFAAADPPAGEPRSPESIYMERAILEPSGAAAPPDRTA